MSFSIEYLREINLVSICLRIVLSLIIGGILGLERGRKNRPAGFRTYILVCLGSTLVMMTNQYICEVFESGDPSRLGAQVISGIGFLGAGMIYFNGRHSVKGLTTAAGIWATSGIGLAIGAGMYAMGIATSLLILVMQFLLHKNIKFLQTPNEEQLSIVIPDDKESMDYINNVLSHHDISIIKLKKCTRTNDNMLELQLKVHVPQDLDYTKLLEVFQESDSISSITM